MKRWLTSMILGMVVVSLGPLLSVMADEAATELAGRIDEHISARWLAESVVPAPAADDAEFLRRTYLNLSGKIPRVSAVREFLAETSPNKRRELVDRLLEGPAYINNFTNVWRDLMIPEAEADPQLRIAVPAFEAWLRQNLSENVPYDKMVRDLLTARRLSGNDLNALSVANRVTPSPEAFYRAKQDKAENVAAGVSRLFLGVRLECAQCHDHPFAKWERRDFWKFAAFFTDGKGKSRIEIPETKEFVEAAFLSGKKATVSTESTLRLELAQWLTSGENRFFARSAVNRLWFHFFGTGLVDPVDDFDEENPPSHPELLDELADRFVSSGFDIKFLIRGITASRAYQLSSRQTDESQADPRMFARMAVKGLSTEQLFDSLAEATGFFEQRDDRNPFLINSNSERAKFRQLFRNEAGGPVDAETTILQALALMNGNFVEAATSLERSTTLSAVVESPFLDTPEQIKTLYLAAFAREPSEEELAKMVQYVDSGGTKNDPRSALGDVFWALLNSSEFILNH